MGLLVDGKWRDVWYDTKSKVALNAQNRSSEIG